MIAYEIQLQYVIRDKIQSENFFLTIFFLLEKNFIGKKILSEKKNSRILSRTEFCLRFPVCFFELSRTNRCFTKRYIHTAMIKYTVNIT